MRGNAFLTLPADLNAMACLDAGTWIASGIIAPCIAGDLAP